MGIGREQGKVRADMQGATTRRPAVAGQFYPADASQLRGQVQQLLAGATPLADVAPKALIAPHAGYAYSGAVAAAAFATLRDAAPAIRRIVLIGPAHYVPFRGIAVATARHFATPLGRVAVDGEAVERIAELPGVVRSDAPHAPEHALEVELPFLQSVLAAFVIVPLVVGDAAPEAVAEVLHQAWSGPETLTVVSSDLSHYHGYDRARALDSVTAVAIERGDWTALGPQQACGHLAVAGLLIEAARRGLAAQRLALCNSGDTAGPRDRVVGYGAWMFASPKAADDALRSGGRGRITSEYGYYRKPELR